MTKLTILGTAEAYGRRNSEEGLFLYEYLF